MPEVSVIIPNFNHAPFLRERIDTVLQQTMTDFEIIILDDASTDHSREIIESYRANPLVAHVIYNDKNSSSPFHQWKKGLKLARGRWVWFAESDDTASEFYLERLLSVTKNQNDLAFIYCDSLIQNLSFEKPGSFATIKNRKFNTDKWSAPYIEDGIQEVNDYLKWECVVNNASAVLFDRASLLISIDKVCDMRFHGDWLMYLLIAPGKKVAYLPEPLNTYREHAKNHSVTDKGLRAFKTEHFKILDHLLKQDYITEKDKLFHYFTRRYTGFGFWSEPAFGKKGIFKEYAAINSGLTWKTVWAILSGKIRRNKRG